MSEKDNKNPSIDKDIKQKTPVIKSEDPDQDMVEMKKWADEQKKKEETNLADKEKKKSNPSTIKQKNSSAKGQPSKQIKKASTTDAKEMPKVGSVVKNTEPKTKSTAKPTAKPVSQKTGKPAAKQSGTPTKKGKKKHNYLLWAACVVVLIPCLLLVYILIGSMGSTNDPIEGNRFKGSLDPEITKEEVANLQSSLSLEDVESINITLKSATLRVTINANDDVDQDTILSIMSNAYDQIVEKFPAETYFKNRTDGDKLVKMYDLDIQVYNFIPKENEDGSGQIHVSRTLNSAAETYVDDVLSSPKDEATREALLNPDTSTPPSDESSGSEEGE